MWKQITWKKIAREVYFKLTVNTKYYELRFYLWIHNRVRINVYYWCFVFVMHVENFQFQLFEIMHYSQSKSKTSKFISEIDFDKTQHAFIHLLLCENVLRSIAHIVQRLFDKL